jgi:methionine-rich copper-binding protein CopC
MRRAVRIAVALAVALVAGLVALSLSTAGGQSAARGQELALASATPGDGEVLARPPAEVELAFTAPFDPDLSHVDVQDTAGTNLNAGRLRQVAPDRLTQPVRATAAGDMTVAYHMVFADGGQLAGTLRFSAGAGARAGAAGGARAEPAHEHGVDPLSAALLVIDGVVALGAVVLLLLRPSPRSGRRA